MGANVKDGMLMVKSIDMFDFIILVHVFSKKYEMDNLFFFSAKSSTTLTSINISINICRIGGRKGVYSR